MTTSLLYDPALDTPGGGHQPPLDGMPPFVEKKRAAKRKPPDPAIITWRRYKVQRPQPCSRCAEKVREDWMQGLPMRTVGRACYRRSQKGETMYLCWVHTEEQRTHDGLPQLRAGGKGAL